MENSPLFSPKLLQNPKLDKHSHTSKTSQLGKTQNPQAIMSTYHLRHQKRWEPIHTVSSENRARSKMFTSLKSSASAIPSALVRRAAGDHRHLVKGKSNKEVARSKMDEMLQSRIANEAIRKSVQPPKLDIQELEKPGRESLTLDSTTMNLHPTLRQGRLKLKAKAKSNPANARKDEEQYMLLLSLYQQRDYLAKSTHFSYEEIGHLQSMFLKITELSGTHGVMQLGLFNQMFADVFGVSDNVMLDRVFRYFDADGEGSISCSEWIQNLSAILRGTLEEQVRFVYKIYDLNGDGGIGREEMHSLISGSIQPTSDFEGEDMYDQVREVVDMIMRKLDLDGSGQVTLQNFYQAVLNDPINLQCLGQCLPEPRKAKTFLSLLTFDIHSFTQNYSLPNRASYPCERERYPDPTAPKVIYDKNTAVFFNKVRQIKR